MCSLHVQNLLISVRIAFWRSSYSSLDITPHSFRLCHLSNWSIHSEQTVILFPGETPGASADLFLPKKMTSLVVSPKIHAYGYWSWPNNLAALVYISPHGSLLANYIINLTHHGEKWSMVFRLGVSPWVLALFFDFGIHFSQKRIRSCS